MLSPPSGFKNKHSHTKKAKWDRKQSPDVSENRKGTTRCYILEDRTLHNQRLCENLMPYIHEGAVLQYSFELAMHSYAKNGQLATDTISVTTFLSCLSFTWVCPRLQHFSMSVSCYQGTDYKTRLTMNDRVFSSCYLPSFEMSNIQ
jgi:hypothetical protein